VPFTVKALADPDRLQVIFTRDKLAGKKIMVDPGHGGKDSGARGSVLMERDVNLDMAKRTVQGLAVMGARPFLTRDADFFVDLYARPRMANALPADLFVSIHCNATGSSWVGSGTGTYYYRPRSKALAIVMQDALVPTLQSRDYGVHQENFCVTRETDMTSILIETLFIDNKAEEKLLAQPQFRQRMADGVCEGLRRYLEGTKSVAPATLTEPQG
jgi:N-acetylmuramoyl-L-alanine amidase